MVYLILIISLIVNVYLVLKVRKLTKFLNEFYCTDEELDNALDRLWFMKAIKKGLYIITLIISLFIINSNIKAFEIDLKDNVFMNEDDIYEKFIEYYPDFNINEYPNIICDNSQNSGRYLNCYAFNNYTVENFIYTPKSLGNVSITLKDTFDINLAPFYYFVYDPHTNTKTQGFYGKYLTISQLYIKKTYHFINFELKGLDETLNSYYNKLDFSKYLQPQEPEVPELEINTKATKLLDFMIDKAKNIYEVLINNEIFKLILSIPLIYLCFLVLSRIIKK